MSNFGFFHLRVVNPYEVAFREARSAVGASDVLARAQQFHTVAEAVADCTLVVGTSGGARRGLQHPLRPLPLATPLIRRQTRSGRVALLFGSEKVGLSNRDLSHCHWLMRIPTREQHASMNLGQAVAVCLYELIRDGKSKEKADLQALAAAGEIERITSLLLEVLQDSGYISRYRANTTEEKIRRLVRRLRLPSGDAHVWMGILRQMLWKLRESTAVKP